MKWDDEKKSEYSKSQWGDLTEWIVWYLKTLLAAIREASATVSTVLNKSFFWMRFARIPLTERQTNTLNLFLDGYEAKITSKTWANLGKCSKDTAIRDIQDLLEKNILVEDIPGAKRPSYSINYSGERDDLTSRFSDVAISEEAGGFYLTAVLDGNTKVKERLLALDAERYRKGELPVSHLLGKYCTYLLDLD